MANLTSLLPFLLAAAAVAQELPAASDQPLDYEPQLILKDPNAAPAGGVTTDLAKLETASNAPSVMPSPTSSFGKRDPRQDRSRAQRDESRPAHQEPFRGELQIARDALANLKTATPEAKSAAELSVKDAEALAQADAAAYQKAQIEAAALNVWRTQKLQGWGSASKAAVARAQEQLLNLQGVSSPAGTALPPRPRRAAVRR